MESWLIFRLISFIVERFGWDTLIVRGDQILNGDHNQKAIAGFRSEITPVDLQITLV
jgi:hypothetical protein